MTKEECYIAINDMYDCTLLSKDNCEGNREILSKLIQEHFELVEKIKTGELSDGYHTFNELYYHRAVLFSVICNSHKDIAWKSKKHHDGTMYNGMFIVGIDTPQGQYSYHYDMNIWSMFDVKELEYAPKWDGHKPSDIDRLLSLNYAKAIQPYKFEDLKVGMFVYDICLDFIYRINKIYKNKDIDLLIETGFGYVQTLTIHFEEGRFYPFTKAMEYKEGRCK